MFVSPFKEEFCCLIVVHGFEKSWPQSVQLPLR